MAAVKEKVNGTETVDEVKAEVVTNEMSADGFVVDSEKKTLKVVREQFNYNGKVCWRYFVKGVIRGREVRASIVPTDKRFGVNARDGFEILDLVFGDSDSVDLYVVNNKRSDSAARTVTVYKAYEVRNLDENGNVLKVAVKPELDADKAKLGMLLDQLA